MPNLHILVVSGTRETAASLVQMLGEAGDTVDSVMDGADAFRRVWETDYDVIVSEVGIPGIDGRDLYMAFQNTWPELTGRMVFVCGEPTREIEQFVGGTSVPFVRGRASVVALRDAVRDVCGAPPARALA